MAAPLMLVLSTVLVLSSATPASAGEISTLWMDPNGDDSWDGLFPNPGPFPNSGPLRTLTGARNKLRQYRQAGQLATDTTIRVKIKPGRYEMLEPLVLEWQDRGTIAAPISFERSVALGLDRPVFSGGVLLPACDPQSECASGCLCVNNGMWEFEHSDFNGTWQIEQLFVNGRRATRARTPNRELFTESQPPRSFLQHVKFVPPFDQNSPCADPIGAPPPPAPCWPYYANWANECVSRTCFNLDDPDFDFTLLSQLTPAQLQEVQLTHVDYWTVSRNWIASIIDAATKTVLLAGKLPFAPLPPTGHSAATGHSRIELSGIPSALDAPGEFHLDATLGRLRYFPFPGEDPATAVVVAPKMNAPEMIHIKATSPRWVQYVSFVNLTFEHSPYLLRRTWLDDNKFTGGYVDSYGGFSLPATITVERGRNLTFDGLEIRHTGAAAFWLRRDTEKVTIRNSYLHDLGGGGIKVVEFEASLVQCPPPPEPPCGSNFKSIIKMGGEHVIKNNVIQSGGRSFYDTNGILLAMSPTNLVEHNDVGDFFNSGIALVSRFCDALPPFGDLDASHDNSVTWNRSHQIGQDFMSDLAGIYMCCRQPGAMLTDNKVFDVRHYGNSYSPGGTGYGALGIYVDGGCYGTVERTLAYDVESGGLAINNRTPVQGPPSGEGRVVHNNIFAMSEEVNLGLGTVPNPANPLPLAATIKSNIFYSRQGYAGGAGEHCDSTGITYPWVPKAYNLDKNLYWGGPLEELSVEFFRPCHTNPLDPFTWDEWIWSPNYLDMMSVANVNPQFADPATWDFHFPDPIPTPLQQTFDYLDFVPFSVDSAGVEPTAAFYGQRDRLERPKVDFGGMYGRTELGDSYGNPLYGGRAACPPGYTDTRTYGSLGPLGPLDNYMGFCHRPLDDQPSLAEFGGMYIQTNGQPGPNALAGVNGCPSGFDESQVLGDPAPGFVDPEVFFCYKTPGSANPQWEFGGMYATTTHFLLQGYYLNPLSGRRPQCSSSPTTFTSYEIIAPSRDVDEALYYCGRANP